MMIETAELKMTWTASCGADMEFGTLRVTNKATGRETILPEMLHRNQQVWLRLGERIVREGVVR